MFIINVEGAVYKEDKWLVIERSKKEEHAGGLLSLVGGTVEKEGTSSDLLERTLKRELFEEVGVNVKDSLTYVRNTSFILEDGRIVVDIVFLCEFDHGEPYAKSPDEVDAVYWMASEEILNHVNSPIWLKDSIVKAETLRKEQTRHSAGGIV
ncbi:8-oxo-dGTP pyrophosphatase MutT (NUDIX family) [Bacillus pakistanensis]|uniref:8-oxo-dGTP pyrophosphatase MutT (NUDIX family) n=1 Tax=Rossellomorea pakistanensis TaxID=992288 RepID=A0ABS2NGT5_9BACI|nr:NUDIX domain-containing protein [Bacillus pakistanensis]MBM7587039.1 8-oxo-dGTP pyrophosphatase MutT (NUDIX family) [Bacillus pakistanensis]